MKRNPIEKAPLVTEPIQEADFVVTPTIPPSGSIVKSYLRTCAGSGAGALLFEHERTAGGLAVMRIYSRASAGGAWGVLSLLVSPRQTLTFFGNASTAHTDPLYSPA